MPSLLLTNCRLVNEGRVTESDVLVRNGRIERLGPSLRAEADRVIDAAGRHLLPGLIDDQVHFREPGLTHKADLATESRAAVAGGVTTYFEMPNTKPATVTLEALEAKFARAAEVSLANHSFFLGATNENLEEVERLDPKAACGVKVFMGSSTGNMLVDNESVLEKLFERAPTIIATHCEDTPMITANEAAAKARFGEDVPASVHPLIRSREACLKSSRMAVELARKTGARLHILHISTADELPLFTPGDLASKRITSEACVHHLSFCDADYATLGHRLKCNPAVKTSADRAAIRQAVVEGRIDVIATDHAPHTAEEKAQTYFKSPSGLPLVQHSLQMLLEMHHDGVFSLPLIVEKTSHALARLFQIKDRGYIREGHWADLVLVDLKAGQTVARDNILYKCGWSPLEGRTLRSRVDLTLVNGRVAFEAGRIVEGASGKRVEFNR